MGLAISTFGSLFALGLGLFTGFSGTAYQQILAIPDYQDHPELAEASVALFTANTLSWGLVLILAVNLMIEFYELPFEVDVGVYTYSLIVLLITGILDAIALQALHNAARSSKESLNSIIRLTSIALWFTLVKTLGIVLILAISVLYALR